MSAASAATREAAWARLGGPWDVVVVGGGITGAGIAREAASAGLRVLLLEQRDFAWGTSSRSSKLVHGGLRYLREGQIRLIWESVREREKLLVEAAPLVKPMSFLLATYRGDWPGRWSYAVALAIYDTIAGCWQHEHHGREGFMQLAPFLDDTRLTGGYRFHDATTDDARLVLRVLHEAEALGAAVVNYAAARDLVIEEGEVRGVRVQDAAGALPDVECRARVVVSATGAWADRLRARVDAPPRMRPLRGSHLVFPSSRFPLREAVSLLHPLDRRAMFVFPWEGVTLVGTTDLDHGEIGDVDPAITPAEVAYLMAAVDARFPSLRLGLDDVVATYSGVRPVVNTGKSKPSQETREHVIWDERGLITVTGGKLTTFRLIAREALRAIRRRVPELRLPKGAHVFAPVPDGGGWPEALDVPGRLRLLGRHGALAADLARAASPGDFEPIDGTAYTWAELRWAARREWPVHLDDLLLRRVRVGLLLPGGGRALLDRVRATCQAELGWTHARWEAEEAAYLELWRRSHGLPDRAAVATEQRALAPSASAPL